MYCKLYGLDVPLWTVRTAVHQINSVMNVEQFYAFDVYNVPFIDVKPSVNVNIDYRVYLCVLCGSDNKQRLFPYTALTGWFV